MSKLSIVHWNDVYRVTPQKLSSHSSETIDVTQFAALLEGVRGQWPERPDGKKDGLNLFSGDVFSPSTESSVTRGSHMVPILNALALDASLAGNHDFDFGYPHLTKLIKDSSFPWLLSNIIDNTTSRVPEYLHEFLVFERARIRVGIIGLVEEDWIATCPSWPPSFEYRDMVEVGMKLSKELRDPAGPHKCELVIALTHSRLPNDVTLAKSLLALSPAAQKTNPIANKHGVDILLGGHDHMYFVSKGVTSWENFDTLADIPGSEKDQGDILIVKSGNDFRDFSELTLELESAPEGSIRRKVVKAITGKRHTIQPNSESSKSMTKLLETLLSSVSSTLKAPICNSSVMIDVRSRTIRLGESAVGNWFADIIFHAYDDTLCVKAGGGADGVLICAGTLRGDSTYGPGNITLGDVLEILPFEDPVVVLELDGEALWAALEASLSKWPALEGRFPVVSGIRVTWDSRRPVGQRVVSVRLMKEMSDSGSGSNEDETSEVEEEEIKREKGGRRYKIVTREYLAQGHDGFVSLPGNKYLINEEEGQLMSTIVRKYCLGARFVNRMLRLVQNEDQLHSATWTAMTREKARQEMSQKHEEADSKAAQRWKSAVDKVRVVSRRHYQDHLGVSGREHMSEVDCFDGNNARTGKSGTVALADDDLIIVNPVIDGRLKNLG